nr:hypothetical protein [Pseudomonas aeruginosa]
MSSSALSIRTGRPADFAGLLAIDPIAREQAGRRGFLVERLAQEQCRVAEELFTSCNRSNLPMRRLLEREGFQPSGVIDNLDEGDPELVFVRFLAPSR